MKLVICDHAGECKSVLCPHKKAHVRRKGSCDDLTCDLADFEICRCVEVPDDNG